MKKLLVLIVSLLAITCVYAQKNSCRVYGASDIVATITNPTFVFNGIPGAASVVVHVELSKKAESPVSVVVECLDKNGNVVAGTVVRIPKGGYQYGGSISTGSLVSGESYRFVISEASCD